MLNPLPVQGFTDDIVIVTHYERSLHEMINVSEPIIQRAKMVLKHRNVLFYTVEYRGTIGIPAKMIKSQILLSKTNIKVLKRNES